MDVFWLFLIVATPASVDPGEHLELLKLVHHHCVIDEAKRLANLSNEPVATLADSAIAHCFEFEDEMRQELLKFEPRLGPDRIIDIVDHALEAQRRFAIEAMIQQRIEKR
jgi:hypothetical protein